MREFIVQEFEKLASKPIGYIQDVKDEREVLLESGYLTGYELLHGTNWKEGGLSYKGKITKKGASCFSGSIDFVWNDIIDPNFLYGKDIVIVPNSVKRICNFQRR